MQRTYLTEELEALIQTWDHPDVQTIIRSHIELWSTVKILEEVNRTLVGQRNAAYIERDNMQRVHRVIREMEGS